MSDRMLKAHSIHIFACPFKFGEKKKEINSFLKYMRDNGWTDKNAGGQIPDSEVAQRENFMLRQYLTVAARDVFFKGDQGGCTVMEYGNTDSMYYYIELAEEKYMLPVDSIEVHLYCCGVGILFIRVLNEDYPEIEKIKRINDYGRRVSLPFIPIDAEKGFILCAEKLGMKISAEEDWITDFRKIIKDNKSEHLQESAGFVEALILHKPGNKEKKQSKKEPSIEFFSDDRMFVVCLLRNDDLSRKIKYGFKTMMEDANELLYELIFVDAYDASCLNKKMRKKLLSDTVYQRWSEYGTIHAVTNYSMLCITAQSEMINESVVRPFVVEYIYLLSLVMAQRFGLASFSEQAGRAVKEIDNIRFKIWGKSKLLENIQKRYVSFKNKIFVLDATSQDQGLEIYRLLKHQLMITEEQQVLDEQLESMYEIVTVSNGERLNLIAIALAIITLLLEFGGWFLENFTQLLCCIWKLFA